MPLTLMLIMAGFLLYGMNNGLFYGKRIKAIEESRDEPTKAIPPAQLEKHYRAMLRELKDKKEEAEAAGEILKAIATGDDARHECPHDPKCDNMADCELTEKIYQADRRRRERLLEFARKKKRKKSKSARAGEAGEETP